MSEIRESDNHSHNSIYYNQMLRAAENKKPKRRVKKQDFGSKKVDFSKYLLILEGYEGIMYSLYFLFIPYIVGITFLFFYVAHGAYENFSLLDMTSFLIIWAIGYEITGAFILLLVFFAFLKHLKAPN